MNSDLSKTSGNSPSVQFEPLLSNAQAGKLLGLHAKTVDKLARQGTIPAFRVLGYWRYRASELSTWLEDQRNGKITVPETVCSSRKERT